jgi:hypothetical protein
MLADGLEPIGRGQQYLFVQRAIIVRRTIVAEPLRSSRPLAEPHRVTPRQVRL